MEKFNLENINKNSYHIGNLNKKIIELLNLNIQENTKIIIGQDKIKYTEKHKHKFASYDEYKQHIEMAPEIVASPDYVALHPNGESIEFIKMVDEIILVAVRVRQHGNLWVKSIFPITQSKLEIYIKSGTAKKVQ
ncbi:hypothetical protein DesLBE_4632 [Desulfitobacterium sp. LBE]|uniref:Phage-Barnase-EndoU-ColicinE5/D-RelE like nuclease 3 domain-containing protein n=2 Tax=root TaxID=1 RepID=A0A098B291_DESHA|nr:MULTISPECIES: PBECR2 nuclease fold domain-containing protein [Desulfitobacterium]MEA5022383.1 PBECR2 nuclease fold domain-containing protein [Desulfitobacterium hafniense]TWH60211.1 hypothetical protein DesLBE_4632 [Desulfitobacterium sp. LBE]CDX02958.1 Hypothetical protein DPCES_3071 [Desulfitobacterium hafniense]